MRRAWVEVDLGALKRNAQLLAQRAGVPLLPMVKADAYGLGVAEVVRTLESLDPWGYGVATVEEGAELRGRGVRRPIIVFTPLYAEEFGDVHRLELRPALGDMLRISTWLGAGGGPWHLAIETGMNRSGMRWDAVGAMRNELLQLDPPEGAFTHFHSAELNDGSLELQQKRFTEAIAALPQRPKFLHAENSPAIERLTPSRWDLARPGVSMYGVGGDVGSAIKPEPVASLHARIVDIRTVEEGETVSYGATWRAAGPRRIATAAAGYADGIRRSLSNCGVALVNGRRAPIVGSVTMDMTMLDVTGIDFGAGAIGEVATFLGRQGDAELTIGEVAAAGKLSPYEVLVGLKLRAPRIYTDSSR